MLKKACERELAARRHDFPDEAVVWFHELDEHSSERRKVVGIYKNLRTSKAGREGIIALMDDPSVAVRLMAAAHSLAWMPEKAKAVLRAIEDDPTAGLHSISAKYTLREFRAGRLSHEW